MFKKINTAEGVSVSAGEMQDITWKEQLAISAAKVKVSNDKHILGEDLFGIISAKEVTAPWLPSIIISTPAELGTDLEKMISPGYDSTYVMSGRYKGAQSIISMKYPEAQYVLIV